MPPSGRRSFFRGLCENSAEYSKGLAGTALVQKDRRPVLGPASMVWAAGKERGNEWCIGKDASPWLVQRTGRETRQDRQGWQTRFSVSPEG